jgi:hypothetical protein
MSFGFQLVNMEIPLTVGERVFDIVQYVVELSFILFLYSMAHQPVTSQGLLIIEASRPHAAERHNIW